MKELIQRILQLDLSEAALKQKDARDKAIAAAYEIHQFTKDIISGLKAYKESKLTDRQRSLLADDENIKRLDRSVAESSGDYSDLSEEDQAVRKALEQKEVPSDLLTPCYVYLTTLFKNDELNKVADQLDKLSSAMYYSLPASERTDIHLSEICLSMAPAKPSSAQTIYNQLTSEVNQLAAIFFSENQVRNNPEELREQKETEEQKAERQTMVAYTFEVVKKAEEQREEQRKQKIQQLTTLCDAEMARFKDEIEKAWKGPKGHLYKTLRTDEDNRLSDRFESAESAAEDLGIPYLLGETKITAREKELDQKLNSDKIAGAIIAGVGYKPLTTLSYAAKTYADSNTDFRQAVRKYAMWQEMKQVLTSDKSRHDKLDTFSDKLHHYEKKLNAQRDSFGWVPLKAVATIVLAVPAIFSESARKIIHSLWHSKSEDTTHTAKDILSNKRKPEAEHPETPAPKKPAR